MGDMTIIEVMEKDRENSDVLGGTYWRSSILLHSQNVLGSLCGGTERESGKVASLWHGQEKPRR